MGGSGNKAVTGVWAKLEVQRMREGYLRKLGAALSTAASDDVTSDNSSPAVPLLQAALDPVMELLGAWDVA